MQKLLIAIAAFVSLTLLAAWQPIRKVGWDPNPAEQNVTNYVVYYATNITTPPQWIKVADVSPSSMTNIAGTNIVYTALPDWLVATRWYRLTVTAQADGRESDYAPWITSTPTTTTGLKWIP